MRLRLTIRRNTLPEVNLIWDLDLTSKPTTSQFLEIVNEVVPLESNQWGLEDYAVELSGFELLHYQSLDSVIKEDDVVLIRPLLAHDIKLRRLSGRHQISLGGKHLIDGIAFGRPRLKAPQDRPDIDIPPRKKRRFLAHNPETDDDQDDQTFAPMQDDNSDTDDWSQGSSENDEEPLLLTNGEQNLSEDTSDLDSSSDNTKEKSKLDIDREERKRGHKINSCLSGSSNDSGHEDVDADELNLELKELQQEMTSFQASQLGVHRTPAISVSPLGCKKYTQFPEVSPCRLELEDVDKLSRLRSAFPHISLEVREEALKNAGLDESVAFARLQQDFNPSMSLASMLALNHLPTIPSTAKSVPPLRSNSLASAENENNDNADLLSRSISKESQNSKSGRVFDTDTARAQEFNGGVVTASNSSTLAAEELPTKRKVDDSEALHILPLTAHNDVRSKESASAGLNSSAKGVSAYKNGVYNSKSDDSSLNHPSSNCQIPRSRALNLQDSSSSSDTESMDSDESTSSDESSTSSDESDNQRPIINPPRSLVPHCSQNTSNACSQDSDSSTSDSCSSESDSEPDEVPSTQEAHISRGGRVLKTRTNQANSNPHNRSSPNLMLPQSTHGQQRKEGTVAPGHGLHRTHKRNARKRAAQRARKRAEQALAAQNSSAASTFEATDDTELDARRRALLEKLSASESIDKPAGAYQSATIEASFSSTQNMVIGITSFESSTGESNGTPASLLDIDHGNQPLNHRASGKNEVGRLSALKADKPSTEGWRKNINYSAVECDRPDIKLSEPPFPFVQRWDPQQQHSYMAAKRSGKGKRRERNQSHFYDEDGWSRSKKRKLDDTNEEVDATVDLDYGEPSRYEAGLVDNQETHAVEATQASHLLNNDIYHLTDTNDLPSLPDDLNTLPRLRIGEAAKGMVITWEELVLQNCQPIKLHLTGVVIDANNENNELQVVLARRDLVILSPPKKYDEDGNRIYERFDAPDEDEDDEPDTGFRVLEFAKLTDPKIVQRPSSS